MTEMDVQGFEAYVQFLECREGLQHEQICMGIYT